MKRAKIKGQRTYTASEVKKAKRQVTLDVTDKVFLIFMAATVDTLGLTEEQMIELTKNYDRYARYIDQHLVELTVAQQTIEKATGMKLKGWVE